MKTQIKRFSKSTLAVVLTLCLLFSCLTVGIVATDAAKVNSESTGKNVTVYLDNTRGWSNVYAYAGVSIWKDDGQGGQVKNPGTPVEMQLVPGETSIYSCSINIANSNNRIAFSNHNYGDNDFYSDGNPWYESVYRDDFNSSKPLFTVGDWSWNSWNNSYWGGSWSTYTPPETKYTVNVTSSNTDMGTVASASVSAGATAVALPKAEPKKGYSFVNWTATTGLTLTDENKADGAKVQATQDGTVTANFKRSEYTVAGSLTDNTGAGIFGRSWAADYTANDMEWQNDTYYTKTYTNVPAGNYSFKVVKNHGFDGEGHGAWPSSNREFTVSNGGATVTIKFDEYGGNNEEGWVNVDIVEPKSYYLTGYINKKDIGGTNYPFSTTDGVTYTLTQTFTDDHQGNQWVTIWDGTIAYHPATNGSGSNQKYTSTDTNPTGDNKWKVEAASGKEVTFTWKPNDKTLSWQSANVSAPRVVGSSSFFTSDWDTKTDDSQYAYKMTAQNNTVDGGSYDYVSGPHTANTATSFEYKVFNPGTNGWSSKNNI